MGMPFGGFGQPSFPPQSPAAFPPQYAPQQFSFVPPTPQQMMQPTPQPATSYAPAPQYGAAQPQAAEVEKILVSISGRDGVNDVINGTFNSIGEHGGRYSFQKPTNEGPIYLYYDQASDNWCVGDQIGSQSYYAVCGPSNGQDMAQQWRVWTGEEWEVDPKMQA